VAAATGISAEMQNQRYARHVYTPSKGDVIPKGQGDTRYVTVATIYNIAIVEACIKANIPVRLTANAARLLAEDQHGRRANMLFEFGRTLIVISKTGAAIVNAPFDALLSDVCGKDGAFVIDIGPIIADVNQKLSKLKRKN
jgi:hypothetical protein